jgi:DNA invertase Pin-like site-specific DNA recombinase
MTISVSTPAAQYVRMSTEHQKYSIEGQSAAIAAFASINGFEIVQTYSDVGKSGVTLKNRPALKQMLADVVGPTPPYRAILVYDVSRFGRFQDTDEPAHYEFLCRSAGIPIHYCAEPFANDLSLGSSIMKSLKRAMAGEYSRELGVKVRAGQRRIARRGFKQGGCPGYGLRRMLISGDGNVKQLLKPGEHKNIITDRVKLVPGSDLEVECVRDIFHMLIAEGLGVADITRELVRRGTRKASGSDWTYQDVANLLYHPKYSGFCVFGRTTSRLYTGTVRVPRSEWILKSGAFEPIVDMTTFLQAQSILLTRTYHKTNSELLDGLRTLLAQEGRLSHPLVKACKFLPSPSTYRHRFGSMRNSYRLIGYDGGRFQGIDLRQRTQVLREKLMLQISEESLERIKIIQKTARRRAMLELPTKQIASVLLVRSAPVWKQTYRWILDPVPRESHLPTLVALLTRLNDGFARFYVFPKIKPYTRARMTVNDSWLKTGIEINDLSKLCDAFALVEIRARNRSST